ncbi:MULTISPECIES: hypothetical protein [unclassified Mesorhizobium]
MGEFEFLFKKSIGYDGPRVIAQEASGTAGQAILGQAGSWT